MILRICLCIPTFNNPQTIAAVLDDALRRTEFPVLVVDDGSDQPVVELLSSAGHEAQRSGRLRVLRHDHNQGKGRAIQFAMRDAVARGFTHLVTVDGDGQHHLHEVEKLVQIAKEHPWDLVIGNRRLKGSSVPGISRFGRNFSNFWVQFQTGVPIADSQSGFRLYPLFQCQNLTFWTKRYDFEIEILIRLMWKNVQVRETEIDVFYPEKDQRISHFDKLWDNARITLLNLIFVVLSLLKTHRSPREVASAFGCGVFIGCTPFFGLHTALVALVAFSFRLNASFMWLGSQISIPPLAPFLVLGSIFIGRAVTSLWHPFQVPLGTAFEHHSFRELLQFASTQFLEWLIGSMILGLTLGLVTAAISYAIANQFQRRQAPKANWSGRNRGGKLGSGFFKLLLKHLDLRVGYFFLYFITPYFYLFAPTARRALNEYWTLASPERSWLGRQKMILKHFFRFGQVLIDRLGQSFRSEDLFTANPHGIESVLRALSSGHAVLFIGAHVGGWDIASSLLRKSGYKNELHIVEYQASELSFSQVKAQNDGSKVRSLDSNRSQQPIFDIHQLLVAGKPVGLMADRPLANRFELVSFLGRLAPFDTTPFRVAAASRTPSIITFGFKAQGRSYDFFALPAKTYIYDAKIDRALQCAQWTSDFAHELELMLRKYPEQWFNFFQFWSSLPKSPDNAVATKSRNNLLEELCKPAKLKSVSAQDPKSDDARES